MRFIEQCVERVGEEGVGVLHPILKADQTAFLPTVEEGGVLTYGGEAQVQEFHQRLEVLVGSSTGKGLGEGADAQNRKPIY